MMPAMLFAWKFRKVLLAGGIAFIIWLGYHHYAKTVEANAVLRANQAQLELALKTEQARGESARKVIDEWKREQEERERALQDMAKHQKKAMTEIEKLREMFAKHDLEKLAREKPEFVQRLVNAGTRRFNRLFECSASRSGCDD